MRWEREGSAHMGERGGVRSHGWGGEGSGHMRLKGMGRGGNQHWHTTHPWSSSSNNSLIASITIPYSQKGNTIITCSQEANTKIKKTSQRNFTLKSCFSATFTDKSVSAPPFSSI